MASAAIYNSPSPAGCSCRWRSSWRSGPLFCCSERRGAAMFESPDQLLMGLIMGVAFGFLLQKGQVAKYRAIQGQLLLKDWTVVKVMATAVVVGSIGVYTLVALGLARLDIWP